jgi:aquaporin Z
MSDSALLRKLIVEFIGPYALVFMGVGAIIATGGDNLVAIALAHGLAIGLMITASGHISGGHFNPAVTIGLLVGRKIDPVTAVGYIIAQILGGVAAALTLLAVYPSQLRDAVGFGVPAVNKNFPVGSDMHSLSSTNALVAEIVGTFFLMFVIFGVAVDQRSNKSIFGLAIGLTITMGIFAVGAVSGAAFNPARFLGPAVVDGSWDDFWIWIVGPIAGAVLASLLYTLVLYPEIADE